MKILIKKEQKAKVGIRVIRKLAREVLKDLGCRDNAELSVLLTDNAGIRRLNKRYRNKDKATDVLSFPMMDFNPEPSGTGYQPVMTGKTPISPGEGTNLFLSDSESILGDIVISVETAKVQASANDVTLMEEIGRLLIHGILHLLGFDHEKGRKEALRMKKEEKRLMKIAKCRL